MLKSTVNSHILITNFNLAHASRFNILITCLPVHKNRHSFSGSFASFLQPLLSPSFSYSYLSPLTVQVEISISQLYIPYTYRCIQIYSSSPDHLLWTPDSHSLQLFLRLIDTANLTFPEKNPDHLYSSLLTYYSTPVPPQWLYFKLLKPNLEVIFAFSLFVTPYIQFISKSFLL